MHTVEIINFAIMCLFFVCYMYQFLYIPISWFAAKKPAPPAGAHRFAVLIAARNEQEVIGNLIDSIKAQDYPEKLIKIFVVADNCTDATARVARSRGAAVFERRDPERRGKGYALDYLLREMKLLHQEYFDGYIVLDADNVLAPDFVARMNETFSAGYDIVTCYRNSKNYGDNWISAGYALWFLRESRYLNAARMALGSSCGVSGTGFLFSAAVLEAQGVPVPCEINVLVTDDAGIRAINRAYRDIDRATDVLSFPMNELTPGAFDPDACEWDYETGRAMLGDMVISMERCAEQAETYGHSFAHEVSYLTVHSVLHLLGYDHVDEGEDKRRMRAREKEIMRLLDV